MYWKHLSWQFNQNSTFNGHTWEPWSTSPICKCNSTTKHGTQMQTAIPGFVQILHPWEKDHQGHTAHTEEATHRVHSLKNHKSKPMQQHCKENQIQTRGKSNLLLVKGKSRTHSKTYTKDDSNNNIYRGSAAGKSHACQCPVHTPHGWESLSWLQPSHSTGPYLLPKSKRYLHTARRKGLSAHSWLQTTCLASICMSQFEHPKLKTAVVRQEFWRSGEQWFHASEMPWENFKKWKQCVSTSTQVT